MDLSIIIVNWNTQELLRKCLQSVKANLGSAELRGEVWVVDNASTDNSVQMLKEQFPWIMLIQNQQNVGFAAANNQAIAQSTGRYILLLNSDTEVKSGAFQELLAFIDAHPQVGAAGSLLLNPDDSLQISCYPMPTLSRELWRLYHLDSLWPYGVYRMSNWNRNTPRKVEVLQGASLLLRREALDQVGLLDDRYFMYTEEVDLCYRLQKGGWGLYWVPQSTVIHYGGQSTRQIATKMFLCLYQSKLFFFRKHYGWSAAQVYKIILLSAALVRLATIPLCWLEPSPQRQRHLMLASRYRHLLLALPKM
jgi:hypothetical protein